MDVMASNQRLYRNMYACTYICTITIQLFFEVIAIAIALAWCVRSINTTVTSEKHTKKTFVNLAA